MFHAIYRLADSEFHRYKTHLLGLDEHSRYMRFGYHIKNQTVRQLCDKWAAETDKHVIFAIENSDLEVVAVAHISLADEPVELAFSVLAEYQRQGMGDALMKRAIEYCQNRGIKAGCMVCLSSNDAIKKLAEKHGILIQSQDGDAQAEVVMPDASPISVWKEVVEASIARMDHLGKAQRKFAQMFRFPLHF